MNGRNAGPSPLGSGVSAGSTGIEKDASDIVADLAEEMDVLCQSQSIVIASDVVDVSSGAFSYDEEVEIDACPVPALNIVADRAEELDVLCQSQSAVGVAADLSAPAALEGQAIRVEITQSVTIAVLGQALGGNDELDVTGSTLLP